MHYLKQHQPRGIALVAILAVLTVLAIMATAFIVQMRLESKMTETLMLKDKTDMLMLAATEHAKAEIFNDSIYSPGLDSTLESWNNDFATSSKDPSKSINLRESINSNGEKEPRSKWFYVKDKEGEIVGRYAVFIED